MCGGSCPGVPLIAQMVYTLLLSTKAHLNDSRPIPKSVCPSAGLSIWHLPGQAGQWVVWGVG